MSGFRVQPGLREAEDPCQGLGFRPSLHVQFYSGVCFALIARFLIIPLFAPFVSGFLSGS